MIDFEIFDEKLKVVKNHYKEIEYKYNVLLDGLKSVIDDVAGVPCSWIYDILISELQNLFLAVNPNLNEQQLNEISEYYIWEGNFGGNITIDDVTYHLENSLELYKYIQIN